MKPLPFSSGSPEIPTTKRHVAVTAAVFKGESVASFAQPVPGGNVAALFQRSL